MAVSTRVVFDFTHLREPDLFLIKNCNISYTKATDKSAMKSKISLYLVVENMALSRDIYTDSFFLFFFQRTTHLTVNTNGLPRGLIIVSDL